MLHSSELPQFFRIGNHPTKFNIQIECISFATESSVQAYHIDRKVLCWTKNGKCDRERKRAGSMSSWTHLETANEPKADFLSRTNRICHLKRFSKNFSTIYFKYFWISHSIFPKNKKYSTSTHPKPAFCVRRSIFNPIISMV